MRFRLTALVTAIALLGSVTLASPATDLFDQATQYLVVQYFGANSSDLTQYALEYRSQLDAACASEVATCPFERAEPIIAQMLAGLQDNHAYYLSAAEVLSLNATAAGSNPTPLPRLGFAHRGFLTPEGGLRSSERLVVNVLPGAPAERAGLRYGDRWVGFDDMRFATLATSAEVTAALSVFTAKVGRGEAVRLSVVRGPERRAVELAMTGEIVNLAQFPTAEQRDDGVVVITLRTFSVMGVGQRLHDVLLQRLAASPIRGLVLDMRGNPGGFSNERWFTAGAFISAPEAMLRVPRYNASTATVEEGFADGRYVVRNAAGEQIGAQALARTASYSGPMALLVDAGCASACEYLSSSFQRAGRGPVIGEPTVGIGATNTQRFSLQNSGAVSVPTLRAFWRDMTPLPDRITPDYAIPDGAYTLFETGRDLALEQAVALVTR